MIFHFILNLDKFKGSDGQIGLRLRNVLPLWIIFIRVFKGEKKCSGIRIRTMAGVSSWIIQSLIDFADFVIFVLFCISIPSSIFQFYFFQIVIEQAPHPKDPFIDLGWVGLWPRSIFKGYGPPFCSAARSRSPITRLGNRDSSEKCPNFFEKTWKVIFKCQFSRIRKLKMTTFWRNLDEVVLPQVNLDLTGESSKICRICRHEALIDPVWDLVRGLYCANWFAPIWRKSKYERRSESG